MHSRYRFLTVAAFVVVSGVMSIRTASELPARMATHWNAAGQPDGTMSKPAALAFLPAMTAVLLVVFALVPRIDPLRENIASFRPVYDWFVVVFTAFMTVIHGGVIAFNLGYEFDVTLLVLAAVAGLVYYVGVNHASSQLRRIEIRQQDHYRRAVIDHKREIAVEFVDPPLQFPETESSTVL